MQTDRERATLTHNACSDGISLWYTVYHIHLIKTGTTTYCSGKVENIAKNWSSIEREAHEPYSKHPKAKWVFRTTTFGGLHQTEYRVKKLSKTIIYDLMLCANYVNNVNAHIRVQTN